MVYRGCTPHYEALDTAFKKNDFYKLIKFGDIMTYQTKSFNLGAYSPCAIIIS
jgi:hypothetical protein